MTGRHLVSCLMVTLAVPERLELFKRSIAAYCTQTHADKELVVVTDGSRDARRPFAEHIATLRRDDIRFVPLEGKLTLGALRNRACEAARGAFLCQWDDDDLYHPLRLEEQLRALSSGDADCVYLEDVMQYFSALRTLYWMNWRATELRAHPGTLLCKRSTQPTYPESGESAERDEDSVVCRELRRRSKVAVLAEKAHLYVYVSHGTNKHPDAHHDMLAKELAISRGLLLRREQSLRAGLSPYDFGVDDVVVQGSNGPAFALTVTRSS